jgi:biotin synthase
VKARPLPKFADPAGSSPVRSEEEVQVDPAVRAEVQRVIETGLCSPQSIVDLLAMEGSADLALRDAAYAARRKSVGNRVHFRGIVEISNLCIKNCYYCGIRRDNVDIERFCLSKEQILEAALWAHARRYGSVVLQSGERTDERFVSLVEDVVRDIKRLSSGELGITLSMGEQTNETYARWFAAGAHRYLLRIETSSRRLYGELHPRNHSYDVRVRCLRDLRDVGYQVGTGVMIGLPGQTLGDLAADVLFFRDLDVDMIGMGPYVVHDATPTAKEVDNSEHARARRLALALRMIAVVRLAMPDINIAATTALQALHPLGREQGLLAGANIIMPIITPTEVRRHYQLYQGKPCVDDGAEQCQECLERRIRSTGNVVAYSEWGDSPRTATRYAR